LLKDVRDYTKNSDKELLDLVAERNENAFTELYYRYWQKLFAIAYNRLKERQTAEDAVHDVFAGLWTNSKLREIVSPENYLAVAIKYVVLDKLKKKMEGRAVFSAVPEPETASAETTVNARQVLELIKTEIEQLPEKCRLIFKYSRNDGMPVKQIAAKLQLSPKTVENQLGKAIRHLRLATRNFFHVLLLSCWFL
jgi:RNA polymerase sigma-70 factor (family 1)